MPAGVAITADGPCDPLWHVPRLAPKEPPEIPECVARRFTARQRLELCRYRAGSVDAYVDAVWRARDAKQRGKR